jgi:hypothetical protein
MIRMRAGGYLWQRFTVVPVVVIALVPVGSASVGSASVGSASVGSASVGSASVGSASVGVRPSAVPGHAVHAGVAPAPAPELALQLQAQLGQHSILAADFMRGRIRGDEDFVQAANSALGRNTEAMKQVVGDLFGADAATTFGPLWADHVVALFGYAGGLADRDDVAQAEARRNLTGFELDVASFFAGASAGRLSQDAAHHAVLAHVDHLLAQADAYAAQDYPAADRGYRDGYRHTYDLGGTLAAALLPAAESAGLRTPIWRLRSELGKLLAEHVVLMADVIRAAVTNAADFTAAADLLNGNTRDLAAAMDSMFGADAAKGFQTLWAQHVEQLVAYAGGTAARDAGRRDRAQAELHDFEQGFAAFLATATGNRLDAAHMAKDMLEHDHMLLRHADAFGAEDYRTAHDIAYETYQYSVELARELADAFGATAAARLPVGGAQTGYGGLATEVGRG